MTTRQKNTTTPKSKIWSEIKSNNYNPIDYAVDIIGYLTDDQDEHGQIIARFLFRTQNEIEVYYQDNRAKTDPFAQQHIKAAITLWERRGCFRSNAIAVHNTYIRKYGQIALIEQQTFNESFFIIAYHYFETPETRQYEGIAINSQHRYNTSVERTEALEKTLQQYKKITEEANNVN